MRLDQSTIVKSESVSYRELDGEAVLYNTDTRNIHILNKTALAVWNLCDVEEDTQAVARAIAARYGVTERIVEPDVRECLNRFEELGLIRRKPL